MAHEELRRALVAHYKATIPGQLQALRRDRIPVDPRAYLASDHMPDDGAVPCVLVGSTSLLGIDFQTGSKAGPILSTYSVNVAVIVLGDAHGRDERASLGRDRLLAALRHATLGVRIEDVAVDRETYTERTSPVVPDAKGRPLAQGLATFNATVAEEIPGQTPTEVTTTVTIAPQP